MSATSSENPLSAGGSTKMSEAQTAAYIDLLTIANKELELQLSNIRVSARNLIGTLNKLGKSKKKQDREYWTQACQAWQSQLITVLNQKQPYDILAETYKELRDEIQVLCKELDSRVVDDITYRFDALVYSLVNENSKDIAPKKEGPNEIA